MIVWPLSDHRRMEALPSSMGSETHEHPRCDRSVQVLNNCSLPRTPVKNKVPPFVLPEKMGDGCWMTDDGGEDGRDAMGRDVLVRPPVTRDPRPDIHGVETVNYEGIR